MNLRDGCRGWGLGVPAQQVPGSTARLKAQNSGIWVAVGRGALELRRDKQRLGLVKRWRQSPGTLFLDHRRVWSPPDRELGGSVA